MDPYAEVISTAIENEDMTLLPELWNPTLLANARGDGAIWRERMTKKIPSIARRYRMHPNTSFPVFANQWRAEELVREKKGNVTAAIEELIPRGADDQVIHLSKMRPYFEWFDLAELAVKHDQNNLTRFFFNKFVRENKDKDWEIRSSAKILFNVVIERGNSELVLYFLHFSRYAGEELVTAFLFAKNDKQLTSTLLRQGIDPASMGYAAAVLIRKGDAELAEKLLAKGATWDGFIGALIDTYNKPLIKKYLWNFNILRSGKGGYLYQRILIENDYEMVDFIAEQRPEMLPGLYAEAKEAKDNAKMSAYIEKLL